MTVLQLEGIGLENKWDIQDGETQELCWCCHLQGKWEYKEFPEMVRRIKLALRGVWT